MNILVIAPDYPDKKRSVFPFVKQIVDQFALMGNKCCVIAPYSITKNKSIILTHEVQKVQNGEDVIIIRPNYISLSTFTMAGFCPTEYMKKTAIGQALKKLLFKPDVIYAHFWESGIAVCSYARKKNIPLFVATGESSIPQYEEKICRELKECVKGVICVSSKNMEESIACGMTDKEKCLVAPNAINPTLFYQKDKRHCREELGLPLNGFIVAFCGAFIHRKGVKVLSDAIDKVEGEPVYSLFIGSPFNELPSCKNILFQGPVKHEEIVSYLCSADVFVLPTLQEGCCNAIIEAMACGLPVVSSNLPFNWDVLNEDNSILVDPSNVDEVSEAIKKMRNDNDFKVKLSDGALDTAKNLSIDKRALKILDFILEKK